MLSGFLGSGKTTLLKYWLEHTESRIGVVVNDVASVNIDAKLVNQQTVGANGRVDTIQLQNGCVCCNLGDELLVAVYDLLSLAGQGDQPFSHIIVELSGVAEPQRVKENFEQAMLSGSPMTAGMELKKVVTLVDASTFHTDYMESKRMGQRPDLMEEDGDRTSDFKVVALLVEQIEAADSIVLNKADLADAETLGLTKAVMAALNEKATVYETSFGKVPLSVVLAEPLATGHEHANHGHEQGQHGHGSAEHGHLEHGQAEQGHAHAEESHGHSQASDCSDPGCTDASHGHSHAHEGDCHDANCSDESHGHSHEHGHGHSHGEDCHDPACADPSHGHSHGSATTAEERFGIKSFTYSARRPFHNGRFHEALDAWPVSNKKSLGQIVGKKESKNAHPFTRVIRSKGFLWLDTYPSSRLYWAHAGKALELQYDGIWWGCVTEDQLKLMERSGNMAEYERAKQEDWHDSFADRRQEIVFIGQKVDEAGIRAILDECLLTDAEMKEYKRKQDEDKQELNQMWLAEGTGMEEDSDPGPEPARPLGA